MRIRHICTMGGIPDYRHQFEGGVIVNTQCSSQLITLKTWEAHATTPPPRRTNVYIAQTCSKGVHRKAPFCVPFPYGISRDDWFLIIQTVWLTHEKTVIKMNTPYDQSGVVSDRSDVVSNRSDIVSCRSDVVSNRSGTVFTSTSDNFSFSYSTEMPSRSRMVPFVPFTGSHFFPFQKRSFSTTKKVLYRVVQKKKPPQTT